MPRVNARQSPRLQCLGFSGLHSPPRLHLGFQVGVMRATVVVTPRRQVRRFAPARHTNKRLAPLIRSVGSLASQPGLYGRRICSACAVFVLVFLFHGAPLPMGVGGVPVTFFG